MGLFQQMKDMKAMVGAAPGLIQQSQQLAATAQAMPGATPRPTSVAGQLAQAQAAMAQANATMAGIAARQALLATGEPGTATVVAARQTGQYVNMAPAIELDLVVRVPGRSPATVTVTEVVDHLHLHRLQPGTTLVVKADPAGADVAVDWSAAA